MPRAAGKQENEGGCPTCTAVLVLLVLAMQDQGEHHQQDDDQAGECHHQEEPPLLVERGLHLGCREHSHTERPAIQVGGSWGGGRGARPGILVSREARKPLQALGDRGCWTTSQRRYSAWPALLQASGVRQCFPTVCTGMGSVPLRGPRCPLTPTLLYPGTCPVLSVKTIYHVYYS